MKADKEQTFTCRQCLDDPNGWLIVRCPDHGHCGSTRENHQPHDYAVKCPHWLRQHGDRILKIAQDAMQAGRQVSPLARDVQDVHAGVYRFSGVKTERARWGEEWERNRTRHLDGAS